MQKLTIVSNEELKIEELLEMQGYIYTVEYVPSRFEKKDFLGEVYTKDILDESQFTLFDESVFSSVIKLLKSNNVDFSYKLEEEINHNYQQQFEDEYPVIEVGGFVIVPPWKNMESQKKIKIIIAPSMGFGTGQSPTTQLCLEWISQVDFTNQTVLDFGSGSGILAIAAAKRNAQHVVALEIDEDACANIEENSLANECQDIIVLNSKIEKIDFLLMNVTYLILKECFDSVWENVQKKGFISGITKDQLSETVNFLNVRNISYKIFEKDMWCGLEVTK